MIESYTITDKGYHPFLIRDGWQVAQLNYMPEQDIDNITRLDVHHETDEVFILLKGHAVLIAAAVKGKEVTFEMELLEPNKTYNIPKGLWHNIAMTEECQLIIVEKSNTHVSDFEHHELTEEQYKEMRSRVNELYESVAAVK
jgi:mannose-6-phosphate isomerase-like protein (cupin superfamily)